MTGTTRHLQLFDFLEPAEVDVLRARVAERAGELAESTVYSPERAADGRDDRVRSSLVDLDVADVAPMFASRLEALLPHVRRELGVDHFGSGELELQLTIHRDGDFFTLHADESQPGADLARVITFVYYFGSSPRPFSGGVLQLHDDEVVDGERRPGPVGVEVEPVTNSIVFFPAHTFHTVTEVSAPAGALRCTVNGWYHRAATGVARVPDLAPSVLRHVQPRLLAGPRQATFAILAAPREVHLRTAALWARGKATARPGRAEWWHGPAGAPDVVHLGEAGAEILRELQPLHERWAGRALEGVGAIFLRYRRGQTVDLHVDDRASSFVSSEIHLDDDAPAWPFVVEVGDRVHSIDLRAGQMVLYAGAARAHGRPEPLEGDTWTSLTLHYASAGRVELPLELNRRALAAGLVDGDGRLTDLAAGPARQMARTGG